MIPLIFLFLLLPIWSLLSVSAVATKHFPSILYINICLLVGALIEGYKFFFPR